IHGVAKELVKERIDWTIETVGIQKVRSRLIANLSKGYRQRIGLAAAIVHLPPILILDEPTIGLDPANIVDIRNLIKSLQGKHTILISSHLLSEIALICSEITILNAGKVILSGNREKLGINSFQELEDTFIKATRDKQ
ncbi:ATP-binding cassette domain-containing protein, partial [Pseudomonas aeruginosa]|uniref:ATP-binding cassette domain-containing protein n=1 Tax=Pseudomonas aeruginosa TaxID=287 RepID=UPI00223877CE